MIGIDATPSPGLGLGAKILTGLKKVQEITARAAEVAQKIVGPTMSRIGGFIVKVAPHVAELLDMVPLPAPAVKVLKFVVGVAIPEAIKAFGMAPSEETPEEMGMKVEIATEDKIDPDDFSSRVDYMNYVREKYVVSPQEIENLTEDERLKYSVLGSGVYISSLEDRYGVTLNPDFWSTVQMAKIPNGAVTALIEKTMKDNSILNGSALYEFFSGKLSDRPEKVAQVKAALTSSLKAAGSAALKVTLDTLIDNYKKSVQEGSIIVE